VRDNFSAKTIRTLADRVGYLCSNPDCRRPTSGPALAEDKAVNVGVAAHITAASPGGPRYDESLPQEERRSASNAIWLCHICAKLIDSDIPRFPTDLLRKWKQDAIERAFTAIATSGSGNHRRDAIVLELDDTDREFLRGLALAAQDDVEAVTARMHDAVVSDIAAFRGAREWPPHAIALNLTLQARDRQHSVTLDGIANGIGVAEGLCLVSPPGTGKTITLVQLADRILGAGRAVAVLVPLGEWSDRLEDFFAFLTRRNAFHSFRRQHFMQLAYHGRLVLMLDGWNELIPHHELERRAI
jgi:hypothetical protein